MTLQLAVPLIANDHLQQQETPRAQATINNPIFKF